MTSDLLPIANFGIHQGEESYLEGTPKIGMITFSGCILKCTFCYTPQISRLQGGPKSLSEVVNHLINLGAQSLMLISPEHLAIPWKLLSSYGLPIIVKTSGPNYPRKIDQYLPHVSQWVVDFKGYSGSFANRYQLPENYGELTLNSLQYLKSENAWVSIRHLIMPNELENTIEVLEKLSQLEVHWPINLMKYFWDLDANKIKIAQQDELNLLAKKFSHLNLFLQGIPYGNRQALSTESA